MRCQQAHTITRFYIHNLSRICTQGQKQLSTPCTLPTTIYIKKNLRHNLSTLCTQGQKQLSTSCRLPTTIHIKKNLRKFTKERPTSRPSQLQPRPSLSDFNLNQDLKSDQLTHVGHSKKCSATCRTFRKWSLNLDILKMSGTCQRTIKNVNFLF